MKINGVAGGAHFWNLVKLDGEWYHVDCDSDDVDSENRFHYRFFLIDDSNFPHTWYKGEYTDSSTGRSYSFPLATSTKYIENLYSEKY